LARQFAQKHGISEQLRDLLCEQIRINIESVRAAGGAEEPQLSNNGSAPRGNNQNSYVYENQQKQPVIYDEKMDEVMSLLS